MRPPIRRGAVVAGAVAGLTLLTAAPGLASGSVDVVVRKTLLVTMDPNGSATSQRVYTQLTATGSGTASVVDPVGGGPLRNLNGFQAPPVSNGKATYQLSVNGRADRRTVQDFTGKVPVQIRVAATLDGKSLAPGSIVDRSGLLKVTYTVTNVSGVQQTIQVPDGHGATVPKTVPVPVPLVGTMATTLPSGFAALDAPGAAIGADGHGGNLLNWTLLLFEPLGSSTVTLSYQAQVSHASLPSVEFQFLPVAPATNPTTKSAQDQYKGGQDQGSELTSGATKIDSNLLRLQAGAGQLLGGLKLLYAGANQLSDGLNNQAVPGSQKLAAGLAQADGGGKQLASGTKLGDTALNLLASILNSVPGWASTEAGQPSSDLARACAAAGVTCSAAVSKVVATWATNQVLPLLGSSAAGCDQYAELLCGSKALMKGAAQLSSGLDLLAAGAAKLHTGLEAAGSGASQIANGLGLAVPGGSQIQSGAGLLSSLGTKKLIAAGASTASTFGEKYAVMQALNARIAAGDGIPNGAATGATTTAAYDFRLAAATNDSSSNLVKLVLIVVLFAAALVGIRLLRRS